MKAIIYRNYGSPDVLKCEEIEKPTPGDDEVLIRVRAAFLNPLDYHLMKGGPYIVRILLGLLSSRFSHGRKRSTPLKPLNFKSRPFSAGKFVLYLSLAFHLDRARDPAHFP
jgi:hypothetical protein